ncbi:hypothetical protein [Synechocystis sp. PCC 7509]|uniref:hypothetical protein n=1 Tax=Synechocystis sp. PCC 7509 TaxID=927677 RepID=UPI0002AB9E18|nr:hypothetical protein [Synechocystis sp. PCC 7509]
MKSKALLLALTILGAGAVNFPVNASPITLKGEQGVYVVDFEAGTYQGCVKRNKCLYLGSKHKIGSKTWQNGNYKYEITYEGVVVTKNGKLIFSDYIPSLSGAE